MHLDKHLKHRAASAAAVQWTTESVYVRTGEDGGVRDESELKRYLIWRCAVASFMGSQKGLGGE